MYIFWHYMSPNINNKSDNNTNGSINPFLTFALLFSVPVPLLWKRGHQIQYSHWNKIPNLLNRTTTT